MNHLGSLVVATQLSAIQDRTFFLEGELFTSMREVLCVLRAIAVCIQARQRDKLLPCEGLTSVVPVFIFLEIVCGEQQIDSLIQLFFLLSFACKSLQPQSKVLVAYWYPS